MTGPAGRIIVQVETSSASTDGARGSPRREQHWTSRQAPPCAGLAESWPVCLLRASSLDDVWRLTPRSLGRLGDGPSSEFDPLGQEPPTEYGQLRPTGSHERLLTVWSGETLNRDAGLSFVNALLWVTPGRRKVCMLGAVVAYLASSSRI